MKTLQNNFTTPEQSKRLLELGVPADSADCYYTNSIPKCKNEKYFFLHILPHGTPAQLSSMQKIAEEESGFLIPCWSVGRLVEIGLICSHWNEDRDDYGSIQIPRGIILTGCSICEALVRYFKKRVELKDIDFSKLED